jgi:hypothetical protein
MSLRTDNAPKLSSLTAAVTSIALYLNISQIKTGGHNPRGNSICERVNQSLGAMMRKLSDADYANIEKNVFQHSNSLVTPHSIQRSDAHH